MLAALITATEQLDDNDVVAGWTAFWIFIALAVATGLLLWNFTKQLKKTKANADRGVFGDPPVTPEAPEAPEASTPSAQDDVTSDDEHRATNGS